MLAHYLVAEEAARRTRHRAGRLVAGAFDAFKVGAQGPDVFFYAHLLRPRRRGGLAHVTHQRRMAATFRSMLAGAAVLPVGQRDAAFAFVAGYAAHLCLDAEAHPWVMYWTGDVTHGAQPDAKARAFRRHGVLEASVDVILCRERSADTGWLRRQRLLHLPARQARVVSVLLSRMLDDVFGARFTPSECRSSFRAMELVYGTMTDPRALPSRLLDTVAPLLPQGTALRAQIYPAAPAPTAAGLYAGRRRWYNPSVPDAPRTETFAELFETATTGASLCLEAVAAVADGETSAEEAVAVIGDRSMFTGLACDDRRPAIAFAPRPELLWEDDAP